MEVANPIQVGFKYIIEIIYDGYVNSNGNGLHWRSYTDTDGSTKLVNIINYSQGLHRLEVFYYRFGISHVILRFVASKLHGSTYGTSTDSAQSI
jgi:hypothetical protein